MKRNKYYVSAKQDNLDLGMVIEAENPYMAAVNMASLLWDGVTVIDVDMMEAKNDK